MTQLVQSRMAIQLFLQALFILAIGFTTHGQDVRASMLPIESSVQDQWIDSLLLPLYPLLDREEWQEADMLLERLSREVKKEYGKTSPAYATVCQAYGRLWSDQENDSAAEAWFLEARDIRKKTLGQHHPAYAESLMDLGQTWIYLGQLDKAWPCLLEAADVLNGRETIDRVELLNLMAEYHTIKSQYNETIPLYREVIRLIGKIHGEDHPEYVYALNNLAETYRNLARFNMAEPIYLEAIAIAEKTGGRSDTTCGMLINNLALLYYDAGEFEKAEPLFLEALDIAERSFGREHIAYAQHANNLAQLYLETGQFVKAETHFLHALDITEKNQGKEDPEYGGYLGNLGRLYLETEQYDKALPLLLESLENTRRHFGQEHEYYAICTHDLGRYYQCTGQFEQARKHHQEATKIVKTVFGNSHPMVGYYLLFLGNSAHSLGFEREAESILQEARSIIEASLGKSDPWAIACLNALAMLYESQARYPESTALMMEVLPLEQNRIMMGVQFLSEQELVGYLSVTRQSGANLYRTLFARPVAQAGVLPALSFDNALFEKGFLLQAAFRLRNLANATPEAAVINTELKSCRRHIAHYLSKPLADRQHLKTLEDRANRLEQQLARMIAGYAEVIQQVKWTEVRNALPPEAIAIEFIHFAIDADEQNDRIGYAALLLRPDAEQPLFIPLFMESDLSLLVHAGHVRKADYVNDLYAGTDRGLVQPATGRKSLYDLIWAKIDAAGLQGVSTVYYASSGVLHRLNLGAIAIDDETILSDRYQFIGLGSTRQIVIKPDLPIHMRNALLVGGVHFDPDPARMSIEDGTELASRASSGSQNGLDAQDERWSYLTWTEKEVVHIAKTLSAEGFHPDSYSGMDATEDAIKSLGESGPSPRILHLATHGFFFPDPERRKENPGVSPYGIAFKQSDHPMIRSGLILAGGNYAWQYGKPQQDVREDGILTAYEISQMDLTGTELVVLSACETGLGDIRGNEGVYGLQRAFKIAGVRYLIMSLWQVPDRQTMQFMASFYNNWLGKGDADQHMDIPEAFRQTQRDMRDRFFDPYSWAGFVLVE